MNPEGTRNLIPLNKRSEEQRKEIATKGGKASGEARRQKSSMKDIANHILYLPKHKGRKIEFESIKTLEEIDSLNIDLKTFIVLQQLKKASEGNLQSAKWIQALIGEDIETANQESQEEEIRRADDFIISIKTALDNMQIEGVDYEFNEKGERIPLKNGFPIPEEEQIEMKGQNENDE